MFAHKPFCPQTQAHLCTISYTALAHSYKCVTRQRSKSSASGLRIMRGSCPGQRAHDPQPTSCACRPLTCYKVYLNSITSTGSKMHQSAGLCKQSRGMCTAMWFSASVQCQAVHCNIAQCSAVLCTGTNTSVFVLVVVSLPLVS